MTLESLLRPALHNIEETLDKQDLEGFIKCYSETAAIVDITEKKVHSGRDEIGAMFKEWLKFGKWTAETTNEKFGGGEELIRYSAHFTLKFEDGKQVSFNILQYWRKAGDSYEVENEHFSMAG
ncbi:unnamed protein product, partial [Mesorhabditis spiculigera]